MLEGALSWNLLQHEFSWGAVHLVGMWVNDTLLWLELQDYLWSSALGWLLDRVDLCGILADSVGNSSLLNNIVSLGEGVRAGNLVHELGVSSSVNSPVSKSIQSLVVEPHARSQDVGEDLVVSSVSVFVHNVLSNVVDVASGVLCGVDNGLEGIRQESLGSVDQLSIVHGIEAASSGLLSLRGSEEIRESLTDSVLESCTQEEEE